MVKLNKKNYFVINNSCKHKFVAVKKYVSRPKGETRFPILGKYKRKYLKCLICDHHIGSHNYDLTKLYDGNYINKTYGGYKGLIERFKKISTLKKSHSDNYLRCKRLVNFFLKKKKSIKVLDVGAGIGIFPYKLKSEKFNDIHLIETDNTNIKFLKDYLNFKNTFNSPNKINKKISFDLITLNKVIEHIPDPKKFVQTYMKKLNTGGYLYIEVPDVDAKFDSVGYNREEFFIEHHHVFSKKSLELMLKKLKLKILKLEKLIEPSSKYTISCIVQKIK
jgi:2-polyprenyl-3-methyl-5-hydroxy-6-metoxy-1,4-benzoquinol methylase|tara:strand:- start:17805 stop:18635 length:831 start_codon:yes stop_codon:yes gene_type:complete